VDVPRELAQRTGRSLQSEAVEDPEFARAERDTSCPFDEFASVDLPTLRRRFRPA
jgi:hypothetical protein